MQFLFKLLLKYQISVGCLLHVSYNEILITNVEQSKHVSQDETLK